MCIISSNIRFASTEDGDNTWHKRKAFLTTLLDSHSPDILCSQEGRKPQILEFASLLKNLSLVDDHRKWIDERMYPCIYINKQKLELIESADFWLSETPTIAGSKSFNSAFPRLCSWAKLKDKESLQSFFIFNTHLDHLQEKTRQEQAKVLIREIEAINSSRLPTLLCGDFNEGPHSEVHSLLTSKNLTDPWIKLSLPEETSFNKFQKNYQNGKRIDWILHSPEVNIPHIFLDKTDRDPLFPSDHFPLIANFNFKDLS